MVLVYALCALLGALLAVAFSWSSNPGVIAIGAFVGSLVCLCLSLTFAEKEKKSNKI